jgi:arylsulfatase A-like enzyme
MHQGFEELHEATSVHDPGYPAKSARTYVDRASDWIERHQGTPFFMFLHVFDPHDPFEPRSPYDALWADPSKKAEHQKNLENVKKVIENPLLKQFGMPNRAELEKAGIDPGHFVDHDNNWYDGSIRGMDAEVARLLERLRRSASSSTRKLPSSPTTAKSSSSTAECSTAKASTES